MSDLGKKLVSLISTRSSTQDPDPGFDLIVEVMRHTDRRYLADVPKRVDGLIKQYGSAEGALAALEHDASGRSA
jgi:hypothetical protein